MTSLIIAALLLSPSADTLPVPHAYQRALQAETRSADGAPGARYWQQQVDYRIQASLDPAATTVTGSEVITYHNNSPNTLDRVVLDLGQNVYAPGNPRDRTVPVTGGFTLDQVVAQGTPIVLEKPRGAISMGTVADVPLPSPIAAGGTAELRIDWSYVVPEGTFRGGREGKDVFYMSQWYPQVAVYDDLRGWVRDPYMGDGEFYQEYGDFDVDLTAPAGWLVSATGVLQNVDDVLTPDAARRLRSTSRDGITHVVSRADRDAGRATAAGGSDGTLTWHYTAENVRDFAWGASDRYVWDATVAEYKRDDGSTESAAIYSLYRPEKPNWDRSAEFARHAIEFHSRWYSYPWPQMTVNEGVIGGGMEYPMITIIGGGRSPQSLYGTISHELGHMWCPMVVGSDERNYAWMDEGFATFAEDMASASLFPDVGPEGLATVNGYLRVAGSDDETPSMRPADLYGPFGNRGVASYQKPASVFRALRTILGPQLFDEAMRTYMRRWAFKHPHPLDLFHTFEDVAAENLAWYFYPWMYTTRVMDQAVVGVVQGDGIAAVQVEDHGDIPMPVIVEVTTASGNKVRTMAGVDVWRDKRASIEVKVDGAVTSVVLDPEQRFPDVNREDNRWTPTGS
ncbi:MAG: M1 family metallopeptidase [Gemmatimonadetes bacterium]|nr:M1 family metallopeptidase [Gemmatimonadota bacterium]